MSGIAAIGGIGAVGGFAGISGVSGVSGVGAGATAAAGQSAGAGGFAAALGNGVAKLQTLQSTSDSLAVKAATGDLTDIHDYMIASSEAKLATDLTVAVRNKAVDAFTEIMRMSI